MEVQPAQPNRLLRILGVAFGLAVTVGGTIGVGILRAPAPVAGQIGSARLSVAAWMLGGLYVLLSAFSVAELGTMLPQAGGFYVYTRRAFGDAAGFTAGWVDWLTQATALAYLSISMAEFSVELWPGLAGWTTALAIALIGIFSMLQWRGTRVSGRAQELACVLQACAFLALIAACFTFGNAPAGPATAGRVATGKAAPALWISVMLALRLVIGTFDGWYSAIYFSEEVRDPGKDLPRSMVGGIAVVIAVYVLVNAALLHVLPVSRLAGSTLPAADAAEVLFGRGSGKLVTILCLVSLPATFNSALLCATRISFAMSRDNLFWVNASSVNRRGTPELAMALSAAAGVLLAVSGTFEQLLTMVGVWNYATFSAALASVLRLRRREPGLERPFTVRPYPGLTLLALGGGCALLVGAATGDPKSTLQALGLAAAGYPVYRLSRRFAARLAPLRRTPPGRTG